MRLLLLLLGFFIFQLSFAQTEIKLEDVNKHIGDSVKVQGIISGVRYLETSRNTPTLINVGGIYPNQLLTVVVWGNVRKSIAIAPFEIVQDAQKERE